MGMVGCAGDQPLWAAVMVVSFGSSSYDFVI